MAWAAKSHSGGTKQPSRASGVTTNVTQGTAIRLASKPTNETCPNSSKVNGANARVMTHCSRSRCFRLTLSRRIPAVVFDIKLAFEAVDSAGAAPKSVAKSTPTATKLSQKPACNKAQGSQATTTAQASIHTWGQGQRAPVRRRAATVASMMQVRCAGTPQPAKAEYASATPTPQASAAVGAGKARHSRPERRHSQSAPRAAPHASIVMCRPEMLTKCATPVALKTSQSARSTAA